MKWIVLYISLLLVACNPLKKAVRTMDEYPAAAALYCADRFPVRDSIIVRDSISFDTLYEAGDTIKVPVPYAVYGDTSVKAVCPPAKIITRTIRRDSLIIRRDVARETVLRDEVDGCQLQVRIKEVRIEGLQHDLSAMKKNRNWWRIACLITWGLIGLGIIWKIRTKLPI
jgi:hypothetical protein